MPKVVSSERCIIYISVSDVLVVDRLSQSVILQFINATKLLVCLCPTQANILALENDTCLIGHVLLEFFAYIVKDVRKFSAILDPSPPPPPLVRKRPQSLTPTP